MITKYGKIIIIDEDGKRKIDFEKSTFNSMMDFIKFLNDKHLQKLLEL